VNKEGFNLWNFVETDFAVFQSFKRLQSSAQRSRAIKAMLSMFNLLQLSSRKGSVCACFDPWLNVWLKPLSALNSN